MPAFIYGLMFIGVTGPGALAGVFTMSVVSIGMVTKLYIDVIEDLDFGIIESLSAIGCTKIEQIRYGILPQIYSKLISIVIYRFDMNLKAGTVLTHIVKNLPITATYFETIFFAEINAKGIEIIAPIIVPKNAIHIVSKSK